MPIKLRSVIALGLAGGLLAACNSSEDITDESMLAEAPEPVLTPAPVVTEAPDGTAVAIGTWDVNEAASGAQAVFRNESGTELLAIRCDVLSGAVTMTMASSEMLPTSYRLDAGGEAARVDLIPAGGGLAGEIEPSLAIWHAFAVPAQVVALTSPDGMKTQYPTHAGIKRVLDACS